MILQTKAIVLRSTAFQETSYIVGLFTREAGKIGVLAKGAKTKNSKFLGKLEAGNLLDIVIHHRPTRSVQILSDANHVLDVGNGFDPERYTARLALADLFNRLLHDQEPLPELFDLGVRILSWIQEQNSTPWHHFPYIMLRIAEHLGVGLRLGNDVAELPEGLHLLHMQDGQITKSTAEHGIPLTENMTRYLACVLRKRQRLLRECPLSLAENRQLVFILDRYLSYHFEGAAPRAAEILFDTYDSYIESSP